VGKSKEEQLNDRVAAAAAQALEVAGPHIKSMTLDFQQSGEVPYRMVVSDDVAPLIGLASVDKSRTDSTPPSASVAPTLEGGA
jgi:hypothetical protein